MSQDEAGKVKYQSPGPFCCWLIKLSTSLVSTVYPCVCGLVGGCLGSWVYGNAGPLVC